MKYRSLFLFSLFFVSIAFEQTPLSSNQAVFSGDVQIQYGESKNGFYYNETLFNGNIQFGHFSSWFQFEFSDPPEIGRSYSGLRKIRLDYQNGPVILKIGDLYEIWGRGLVLNQRDDQAIDLDNGLTGLSLTYYNHRFRGQLLSGKSDIWKSTYLVPGYNDRVPNYKLHHNIFGSDAEVYYKNSTFGVSFLQSREEHPIASFPADTLSLIDRILGVRFQYLGNSLEVYSEYVNKETHHIYDGQISINDSLANRGNGYYGNINFYPGSWSFTCEYKNYSFMDLDPIKRWDYVNHFTGILDLQQPPIVFREPTSLLMSRITHQIDFNNELGFQIDATGPVHDWFTLLLHYARSSRTNSWKSGIGYPLKWTENGKTKIFPIRTPAANPFEEIYVEIDGYGKHDRLHYEVGLGYASDITDVYVNTISDSIENLRYELIDAITIPAILDITLHNGWSLEIKAEYQRLVKGIEIFKEEDNEVLADSFQTVFYTEDFTPIDHQINSLLGLTVAKSPDWSLSLLIDATSVEESKDPNKKNTINPLEDILSRLIEIDRKWISLELVYNITPTHRLSLVYGSLQGGLLCSNGICKLIPAFDDGFKLTLTALL